jgi:osmoprotectant transport system substrate-binding protein
MGTSRAWILLAVPVLWLGPSCNASSEEGSPRTSLGDDTVTIGSFDFAESQLLAEIYAQALEADGVEVHRAFDLGPREFVMPALAGGLIEIVPEYAGTALHFLESDGEGAASSDPEAVHDRLAELGEPRHLVPLAASQAQDTNVFVVSRETADRYGLHSLSDLAEVDDELVFGGPPECGTRPLCMVGLKRTYGLDFGEVLSLDTGGPLTGQALRTGGIDIGLLFSTDPSLADGELVALDDDKALQPAENVLPLVRSEVLEHWGSKIETRLDTVSARLTTVGLRSLNARLAEQAPVDEVAADWLRKQGLR